MKFKNGDRVVLTKDTVFGVFVAGDTGEVVSARGLKTYYGRKVLIIFDRDDERDCDMGALEEELELDIIYNTPLWRALR